MSKVLRTVAVVAGAVALAATGIGLAVGTAAAATAGSAGIGALSLTTLATYASVAGGVASIGATLTAKKPPARGSATDVTIQVDAPQPYMIGRTYSAGVLRHDRGYGPKIGDIKNPYLAKVVVYSGCGPIQEIESRQFDYQPVSFSSGYYSGWGGYSEQLGLTPTPTAMVPTYPGLPGWGPDYKLNGQAAVLWNFRFDKKGKRYASGIPPYGIVAKGVKVYDPRKDSTYAGGSGSHRIDNEATWEYSENPGLHGIAYAYGRYQNGKLVFGVGLPVEGIDMADFVTLANICDANGWKIGGNIFEPNDRWENLKDILAAGGAEPIFAGGKLGCHYRAPRVAMETVYEADIGDGDMEVTTAQSYRDRLNGVVPKFRSEENNWQYISLDTVSVPEYVTLDGEEKVEERQFNLVQQSNQAAQLAAYELVDGREMQPITVNLKPYWRRYMPGDCLHLYLPSLEIDHDAIILKREFNPADYTVTLTFITETPGKHAFALGQTATPPPLPTLTTPEERDDALADEYVAHLPEVINESGELLEDVVNTQNIVPGSVSISSIIEAPNADVDYGDGTITFLDTPWIEVGDLEFSSASLEISFLMNASLVGENDASGLFTILVDEDDGLGYVPRLTQVLGVTTTSGNTYSRLNCSLQYITTQPRFRVQAQALSGSFMPGADNSDIRIENIVFTVAGAKR